jgi:solute carrier family 25 (mitochondrial carnitine/acylcarnitine transporter), member 20/29
MRWGRAPQAVFLAVASLCCIASASLQQQPLLSKGPGAPELLNTTVVDVLAQDEDYSLLVYLLQRSQLIPTLSRLNDSTVFAPTNDAIKSAAAGRHSLASDDGRDDSVWSWALVDSPPPDNVQATLRANLLYHMLNFSLPFHSAQAPVAPAPAFLETLLVPSLDQGRGRPHPRPDGDGLLGDREGQKLRVARREDEKTTFVGVDFQGQGGAKVVKPDQLARNGVVLGIDQVLIPPPSLCESIALYPLWVERVGWLTSKAVEATIIEEHPELSGLRSVLPRRTLEALAERPHVTLFMPRNDAWDALDPLEVSSLYRPLFWNVR